MTDVGISVGLRGMDNVQRGWDKITADTRKLQGVATGVSGTFGKLTDQFKLMGKAMAGLGVLGFAAHLVELEDNMEQTARAAHRLGVSFEGFQALQLTAKRFGADVGTINVALRTFNRQIGDASLQPMGMQAKLFDALGVSIRDAAGEMRSTEDVFRDTIDVVGRIGNQAEKTKVLTALFGEQAADLVTMLGEGTGPLDEFRDHLKGIGAIVGEHVAPSMRDANSVVHDFTDALQGTAMKVMAGAIMAFEDLGTAASDFGKDMQELAGATNKGPDTKAMLAGFREFMTPPNLKGALDAAAEAKAKAAAAAAAREAQRKLREEQEKLRNEVEALRAADEQLASAQEQLWADARAMVDAARTPLERYHAELQNVQAVFDADAMTGEEFRKVVAAINLDLANSNGTVGAFETALDRLFDNAMEGGDDFLALLEDVGKQLAKDIVGENVFSPLKNMAKQGIGSLLGGGLGGGAKEGEGGGLGGAGGDPIQGVFDNFLTGLSDLFTGDKGVLGGLTNLFMGDEGVLGGLGKLFGGAWEMLAGLFTSFLTEMGLLQAWEVAERWALAAWEIAERWIIAIFEAAAGFLGFETGGDITVTRPTLLMVGEKNKAERVRVSPLGGPARSANAQQSLQRMVKDNESGNAQVATVNVFIPQASILTDLTAGQFARRISGAVRRENSRIV